MLDTKNAAELIDKHFAEVTPKQFMENLKSSYPYFFDEDALKKPEESNFLQTVEHGLISSEVPRVSSSPYRSTG